MGKKRDGKKRAKDRKVKKTCCGKPPRKACKRCPLRRLLDE